MKTLENRIPPPILAVLAGAAMYAGSLVAEKIEIDTTLRWALCACILIVAALFGPMAFRTFGKAKTSIDPLNIEKASSLVTWGIYRYTRNPMYVSLALLLCAWCVWLQSPIVILGPLFFVVFIDRFQIVPEERLLARKFGAEYENYKRSVRRWL